MSEGNPSIPERDPDAPRLIEWTGERCVPWAPDPQMIYEHLHRYLWAAELVRGRRVLDLASGEGFGAAILSTTAAEVLGVELDPQSVEHARTGYVRPNLHFAVGDALDLSGLPEHSFDAVVAFEMIEHIDDHGRLLNQITRVLAPGGLLLVSTPDHDRYAEDVDNPFHVHELTRAEFGAVLGARFAHVTAFGQRTITGSALSRLDRRGAHAPVDPQLGRTAFVGVTDGRWRIADEIAPLYIVAIASEDPLPTLPDDATLADCEVELLRWAERSAAGSVQNLEQQLAETHSVLEDTRAVLAERDRTIGRLSDIAQDRERELRAARRELAITHRRQQHKALEAEQIATHFSNIMASHRALEVNVAKLVESHHEMDAAYRAQQAALDAELSGTRARLDASERRMARVSESLTWKALQRLRRHVFAMLGGEDSRRAVAFKRLLRILLRRLLARNRRPQSLPAPPTASPTTPAASLDAAVEPDGAPSEDVVAPEPEATIPPQTPIVFHPVDDPVVSIVIPVYAHAELTRTALESIRDETPFPDYEVIIVDDSEDPPTKALLEVVSGARILVNEGNIGYLRSVARGAAAARGRWLVLCNNDIVVRTGWLGALVERGESSEDIAVVTPKYLYPDGTIAEAGGIIWRDGTGANYGRGHHPSESTFQFQRDVDYGSAAALLVRTDVWREIGGYDERFAPMYYEDADFCFEVRARGHRVVYEPRAEVVHIEGATAGTDDSLSHKRHQTTNRARFVDKWADTLERDHHANDLQQWWHAANRLHEPVVLVLDHQLPAWDRDAGSLRMREILRTLVALGCHVCLLPADLRAYQPYARELERNGVEILYGVDPRAALKTIGPKLALAILSRPHSSAAWLDVIREFAPEAMVVYDTVDLHWLREARRAASEAGSEELIMTPKALAIREIEQALMRATDATIVVSKLEGERVRADVPGTDVYVIPIGNAIRPDVPPVNGRTGIIYVGGFPQRPNVDATLYLVHEIMPRVWEELPDVTLTIVGADAPPEIVRLDGDRVVVAGWVADLEPLLGSARALVAPLRYGAGMKGKITQALAEGLPVVTTPIGAEGLDPTDGEEMLVATDPQELADRVMRILTDDALWTQMSTAGQLLIADRGGADALARQVGALLAEAVARARARSASG